MAFDRDKSGRGIYVCIIQAEAWKLVLFLPEPLRRSHVEIAFKAMRFSEARVGRTGGFFFSYSLVGGRRTSDRFLGLISLCH